MRRPQIWTAAANYKSSSREREMQQAEVINAIAAGNEPYFKNGSFILKVKGTSHTAKPAPTIGRTLVGPSGPTTLGKLWAETTNKTLPEKGFRMDQKTTQRGATDYISDSHGKQHAVRR